MWCLGWSSLLRLTSCRRGRLDPAGELAIDECRGQQLSGCDRCDARDRASAGIVDKSIAAAEHPLRLERFKPLLKMRHAAERSINDAGIARFSEPLPQAVESLPLPLQAAAGRRTG